MQLPSSQRNLGRTAAFIGVVQGLAWAGMSLAAIILHNSSYVPATNTSSYTRQIGILLYAFLIYKDDSTTTSANFIFLPSQFTILMWVYFILSVGWVAVSLDQFVAIQYNKRRQKTIISIWGIVTLIVSIIDLIFTSLLARDYSSCNVYTPDANSCYLAFGIAMTLAARGYTLWLVNVIFSFCMLHTSITIKTKEDKFANLFADHSIPRVILPRSTRPSPDPRSGELEPNFLNNDNSFPSYLYPTDKLDQDTLRSFQSRSDNDVGNNGPSFLTRGEKFSY